MPIVTLPGAPVSIDLDFTDDRVWKIQREKWEATQERRTQKHLQGEHDQKTHGSWAGGKIVKLAGSVSTLSMDQIVEKYTMELGAPEESIRRMIESGKFIPKELDNKEILGTVLSKKFPFPTHNIHQRIDDPDLITVAEVIQNLPDSLPDTLEFRLEDKDLTTGRTSFGSTGLYEPPRFETDGYIDISLQSDNTSVRKAWTVAHEFGHSASMRMNGEKSLVLKDNELLTLLGFGVPETYPEGYFKNPTGGKSDVPIIGVDKNGVRRRAVSNILNHYYGHQGPRDFTVRTDVAPWTRYGHAHPEEAFAEAFAGYMVSPKALKRDRPMLYNWMKTNIFGDVEYEGYSDEPPKVDPWS